MAKEVVVTSIRKFPGTQMELGVGQPVQSWFVYDRPIGDRSWHLHCGPYSTLREAADWIRDIREKVHP